MNITDITSRAGANPRRKRVGRGEGSGMGKTSGRGNKGGGARAGWHQRLLHEGGAFPLFRRVAKRGFNNFNFREEYQVVNVGDLGKMFEKGGHVTPAALVDKGLISDATAPLKILGDGELPHSLTVEAHRFSEQAAKKIEAAGGTLKRLGPQPKKEFIKKPKEWPKPEPKEKGAKKGKEGKEGKVKGKGAEGKAEGKSEGGGKKQKGPRPEGEAGEKKPKEPKGGGETPATPATE